MTDYSTFEQDKENIQPIRHGRSAATLAKIYSIPQSERRKMLAKEKEAFEEKLKSEYLETLDDPLEPYLDYLKWTRENFTTGADSESGMVNLLEKITQDFRDDEYYKNEIRYFKVWLERVIYTWYRCEGKTT
ncbi:unnamed protein product [Ambrosiozyma monospora]|uniref:Unnamed protein product n=1 Tax=Ambrosiozyma monospora TaxID=43982 RepID=A0ACB5U437_AMBMO|nr:unnamed protein product [Ambrosiozyma monospora]